MMNCLCIKRESSRARVSPLEVARHASGSGFQRFWIDDTKGIATLIKLGATQNRLRRFEKLSLVVSWAAEGFTSGDDRGDCLLGLVDFVGSNTSLLACLLEVAFFL
mmetsp:Transcript_20599/g.43780  ORF Transcript_20599/g.43780 Transcript_20599/m.43780 type:complete len:106 (-) Transcript_20599:1073-1390(-)